MILHRSSLKANILMSKTSQKIFAKDAEEAAKVFAIYLRCAGRLKWYAEESKPCKIQVRSRECEAHFNAWLRAKHTRSRNHPRMLLY